MKNLGKLTLKEVGQEMSIITHSDALGLKGGDGSTVVYTWAEYEKLDAAGKWDGGYVEGCGYMMETITVFNMSGSYTTIADYSASQVSSGWDQLWSELGGVVPGYGVAEEGENQQAWRIVSDLLSRGYDGNDNLFFHDVFWGAGGFFGIEVYDAETGDLISVY